MTEDLAYLLAALAFFPASYVLLRLLVVAALWLCSDLLAAPKHSGVAERAPKREERRREQGGHSLRSTRERARPRFYRSSL